MAVGQLASSRTFSSRENLEPSWRMVTRWLENNGSTAAWDPAGTGLNTGYVPPMKRKAALVAAA
jgi:hypothetical protein